MKFDERLCVEQGECRPPHASRKSTAKWCGGKVGIEHQWTWVRGDELVNAYLRPRRPESESERAKRLARYGLGVLREHKVCVVCKKQPFERRSVCHCGEVMRKTDTRRKSFYGPSECPACHYVPVYVETGYWVGSQRSGHWVDTTPPRTLCDCEKTAARLDKQWRRQAARHSQAGER